MTTTLKDFFENQSIEYFVKEDSIKDLMDLIGIGEQKYAGIESTKIISDQRFSVIFNTKRDDVGNKGRHIIDVILTEPTWQQLMDITFGAGCECDTRIVIYDNATLWNDLVSNSNTAAKFASINNDCELDTYVLGATALECRYKDELIISYTIEASPNVGWETNYHKLPTKEEFENAEFWLYFDEYFYFPQERIYDQNLWMKGSVSHLIDKGIDVFPIWTNDGFFMRVTADNFPGHKILVKLVETKRNEIEKHFIGHTLKINRIPDDPVEITVKYDDRPFSVFKSMSIEEKNRCARKHRAIKEEFQKIFRKLIEDIDETDNRVGVKEVK